MQSPRYFADTLYRVIHFCGTTHAEYHILLKVLTLKESPMRHW